MVRVSSYIKSELQNASKEAFGDKELVLFGSRVDDTKKGGDFDLAIIGKMTKEEFRKAKVKFFKYLLFKDLDLPIDLVLHNEANELLKKEIEKGVVL